MAKRKTPPTDAAPATVQSLTIEPRPRAGRPKDEPRQAAIALASILAQAIERPASKPTTLRVGDDGEEAAVGIRPAYFGAAQGRRRLTGKQDPMFPFALATERNVRRIETDPRNPVNALPDPAATVVMRPSEAQAGSVAKIGAAVITVTETETRITGDGWLWTAGTKTATYGTIHATADLTTELNHQLDVDPA
jgi:hypothetical protein